ncbi:MAG: arylamine N-acetyltransferase [Oscillospiraceae bacterium]|nr:arylamine N-acetyltransferase [Oscillospiraceae bacterium]
MTTKELTATYIEPTHDELPIAPYLARIGYSGPVRPTVEVLRALQSRHNQSVPYENLDIMNGVPLSLEIPAIYDKIVTRGRGGYCFETNGLFAWLLRRVGYGVTEHFARYLRDEPALPMRRHRVSLVEAEGETFLCDVGIGTSVPVFPLRFEMFLEQPQGRDMYRIVPDETLGYVVEERRQEQWLPLFSFTGERQFGATDFLTTSWFCESHPDSYFRKANMVAMRTPTGRKTLDGRTFKIFDGDTITVTEAADDENFHLLLKQYFGIVL